MIQKSILLLVIAFISSSIFSQRKDINYDEAKVPDYTLPEVLLSEDGTEILNQQEWLAKRRPEILQLFESQVYGKAPKKPEKEEFIVLSTDDSALDGMAIRKEVEIKITNHGKNISFFLLMYLPQDGKEKHSLFLGLNFFGNQTICKDSGITITQNWVRDNEEFGIYNNKAGENSRGVRKIRWQVRYLIENGYGLATIYYGDIDPDYNDEFQNGIHPLFYRNGQVKPDADEWGSISAWAWGLSRAMDYLEIDSSVDNEKVAVMGHSRLGKTALWAGAQDPRFAIVISNNSGCGGAALSRRRFGETVEKINNSFPHWFCENFKKFNNREDALPVDQHMLIALMAPRPVYVASAEEDRWADPKGEFLSAKNADPVYQLFNREGLTIENMPAVNHPVSKFIGYHIRTGKHNVTYYDWEQYINFANKHFFSR